MQNLFSSQHILCEVKHFYFDKRIWKASEKRVSKCLTPRIYPCQHLKSLFQFSFLKDNIEFEMKLLKRKLTL